MDRLFLQRNTYTESETNFEKIMKIFITGSEGFIGKPLCRALRDLGHDITGYDHSASEETDNFCSVNGDILDYDKLVGSIQDGTDVLIHLAAEHKDEGPTEDDYFRVNETGTLQAVTAAKEKKVKKIILFSTVGVYGVQAFPNEDSETAPVNDYGRSKVSAEKIVEEWSLKSENASAIIVRPTAVYGPGNRANIFRLLKQASTGMFIMPGTGNHHKSIIFLENTVAATVFLLDKFTPGTQFFNLVDEPSISLDELIRTIRHVSGKKGNVLHFPVFLLTCLLPFYRLLQFLRNKPMSLSLNRLKKFATPSHFDGSKIRGLGFRQPVSTEDGIRKTVEWNNLKGWD